MCYEVAVAPDRADYVCPTCGEKTLYTDDQTELIQSDLQACRRELEAIQGLTDVSLFLDESSFCKKCRPDAKKRELKLKITYEDGKTHTTSPVDLSDMILLRDFFKGQLSYETWNDGTAPLKENLDRLRELLGVELSKDTEPKVKSEE
jgi:hypothetical protein